jgi:hypothetical protein
MCSFYLPVAGPHPYFTNLPAEVRTIIYKELFESLHLYFEQDQCTTGGWTTVLSPITNILRVSRQCYLEARHIFYSNSTFTIRRPLNPANFETFHQRYPRAADIKKLVLTPSCMLSGTSQLELRQAFSSLQRVAIDMFSMKPRGPAMMEPPKIKIGMATQILKIHHHMCRRKLTTKIGNRFRFTLGELCEEPRDWILKLLKSRQKEYQGKGQYKLLLTVDLLDVVHRVQY